MTYQISSSNFDNPVELPDITLCVLSFAGFFRFDDVFRIRRNEVYVLIRFAQPNVNYFLFILTLILTKITQNLMGWLLRQSNIREKLTKYLRRRARPT